MGNKLRGLKGEPGTDGGKVITLPLWCEAPNFSWY